MKQLLAIVSICLFVAACGNFHDKQPVDKTYYKNTQSIAWPTEQKATPVSKTDTTYTK